MGAGSDPTTLNLSITYNIIDTLAVSSVFNLLVKLDYDLNPRPDLAESWKISEDGLTYSFHLVKNAPWHDGKPFTSADVKFNFTEVLNKHHPRGAVVLKAVESIETPDAYTVVFKLKHPYDPLMKFIGNEAFIIPKHLYENTDILKNPYNLKPIGTGPFIFKEWKKGSHITLERNPAYFKKGKPYVDKIIIKIVPDAASRMIAFESKEIDYLYYVKLPSSEVSRFKNRPGFIVSSRGHEVGPSIMMIAFANASGYSNKEVDDLFDLAERAPNVKKRAEYYYKVQDIIVKDLPYLWISEYGLNSAWRDEFKGLHSWCARSFMSYGDDVWWVKGKESSPK